MPLKLIILLFDQFISIMDPVSLKFLFFSFFFFGSISLHIRISNHYGVENMSQGHWTSITISERYVIAETTV